ncbi:neurexin-1a-like [Triplophysa dalaica]|uniref:neurexin-1a-like n=1 Tax=Triplophysa dalaica TaxID=1582913 RepID=UPI0024DFE944|nr:neurexin-1a-like [Triplophysa dalaica]
MTSFTMRNGAHLIWIGLLVCCLVDMGASMEFTGAEGQWARFPMWNACCESEMSFNMKTKSAHGLLVYFDDEGFCDFLELLIHNGRLSLRFSIFCAEPATVLSDTAVNDSRWHAVTLRRNFKNTTLVVDDEIKWVEVKSKRRDMTVFSHLFLGGIPPELRSVALRLTSSAIKDQVPYNGWITNLRVNGSEPVLVGSEGINSDVCEADHICLNGGVCSIVNDEPICDCSETGFQGKDCSEEEAYVGGLAHLMMGDQGMGFISYSLFASITHALLHLPSASLSLPCAESTSHPPPLLLKLSMYFSVSVALHMHLFICVSLSTKVTLMFYVNVISYKYGEGLEVSALTCLSLWISRPTLRWADVYASNDWCGGLDDHWGSYFSSSSDSWSIGLRELEPILARMQSGLNDLGPAH